MRATYVRCDGEGYINPDDVRKAITPRTRLIALLHASNVTGAMQPVAEVGAIAREHDALFLVDAAQSLGHVPVDVTALGCDLLAAPGHKGLYGPLGTGVLYIGRASMRSWCRCGKEARALAAMRTSSRRAFPTGTNRATSTSPASSV